MTFLTVLAFAGIAIIQGSSGWMMQKTDNMGLEPVEQYQLLFFFWLRCRGWRKLAKVDGLYD